MRKILITLLFPALVMLAAQAASAANRVALVIGNSAYENISPLANPKNDAALMARTLEEFGFEVVTAIDADRRAMGRAIRTFGKTLRRAGKDAVGLFYFAGHGIQARGTNFLIPVGAIIEDAADLEIEALSASDILGQMESAGNALNLIILDACRNNPLPGEFRTATRGLARIQAVSGSLVAFAAAPGQVASDGEEANSPYTAALVRAMKVPGLAVEQVFKQVRVEVERETGGQQTPWEESSLRGEFYFTPAAAPADVQVEAPATRPAAPDNSAEILFWETVKDSGDPTILQTYLDRFPNGVYSTLAKIMISRLEAEPNPSEPVLDGAVGAEPAREPAKAPDDEQQIAMVDPDTANTPAETLEPDPDLPRKLQSLLDQAGCNPGGVDGKWGRNSRAALQRFARYAKVTLPGEQVSPQTLELLEKHPGRICPLSCGPRQVEREGRCVTKTCPPGQRLTANGRCVTPSAKAPGPRKPTRRTTGRRNKVGTHPICGKNAALDPTAC